MCETLAGSFISLDSEGIIKGKSFPPQDPAGA